MRNYKIFILFILLSVVSFGVEYDDPNNNAIGVWVSSIGYDSVENVLKLTLKSSTGEKFNAMSTLTLTGFEVLNGVNTIPLGDVEAKNDGDDSDYNSGPKIITTWIAEDIHVILTGYTASISGTIMISDIEDINNPDGNQHAIDGKTLSFGPFAIAPNSKTELRIYEKLTGVDNWTNITTSSESKGITDLITIDGIEVGGYVFTKGGPGSFEENPGVYAVISTDGGAEIVELEIIRNGGTADIEDVEEMNEHIGGFEKNKINTVTVRPISEFGIKGDPVTLNFVLDTQVNTLYLEDGIIGEIEDVIIDEDRGEEPGVIVNLADIKELSGINWYSYTLKVGEGKKSDDESVLNVKSSTTLAENSIIKTAKFEDGQVKIPTSGFIAGSKGTLLFTVYDRLGHGKTFEKTYFIPDQSEIKATIQGEAKQRKSRVKVVSEGSSDKFEVESSIDTSSEDN